MDEIKDKQSVSKESYEEVRKQVLRDLKEELDQIELYYTINGYKLDTGKWLKNYLNQHLK